MTAGLAADVWAAARRDLAAYAAYLQAPVLVLRDAGLLWLSGGPTADFNMAVLEAGPDDEAILRDFIARVRASSVPAVFMLSSASNALLGAVARSEGLSEAGTAPLMLLRAAHEPGLAHDFQSERVGDARRLGVVAGLIASAFGLDHGWVGRTFAAPALLDAPSVRFFLSLRDGEPYSTVTTTAAAPDHGFVGIWNMATAPEHQRHGAGHAVLEAAIQHHRAQGNDRFYLIATPPGKPLYDAFGFKTVDELAIWTSGHSEQFGP